MTWQLETHAGEENPRPPDAKAHDRLRRPVRRNARRISNGYLSASLDLGICLNGQPDELSLTARHIGRQHPRTLSPQCGPPLGDPTATMIRSDRIRPAADQRAPDLPRQTPDFSSL